MTRRFVLGLVIALSLLTGARSASAHPHVWADYWVEVVAEPGGITRFNLTWRFDTMFSQMIRDDLKITDLTSAAIAKIRDKAFANLKNYHYYTHITADGVTFKPQDVQNFTARVVGEQLEYSFTITLPKPAQQAEISLYDEELYLDIGPPMTEGENNGSFMAKSTPVPQAYVTVKGQNGGNTPVCTQNAGEPRTHPVWGQYKTFKASCSAQGSP